MPDATEAPEDVRKPTGVDTPPGSGPNAGGIEKWDHDNDPTTPPKTLVPGIDTAFEAPDGSNVFDHARFLPEEVNPNDVIDVLTRQINPCAAATCTAQETADGKDNLPDVILLTKTGRSSYTLMNDPNNPGTLKEAKAIGSNQYEERDVEFTDINYDGVPDMIVINHDGPNAIYYGDGTRPGDYSSTRQDTFGDASDGAIKVELVDLDNDASTRPDLVVANADGVDHLYLALDTADATGAGTGFLDMYYKKYDIPSTDTSTTTDVAVEKDFGATGNEVLVVFANEDGVDQVLPLNSVIKNNILTSSVVVLSPASLYTLDSGIAEHSSAIEVADVTGDGLKDIIVILKDSANGVAGYVYPQVPGSPISDDVFVGGRIPIGGSAIKGVDMVVFDADGDGATDSIEVIDDSGGVHRFIRSGTGAGSTWPDPTAFPDPNAGPSDGAKTTPHDHQDAGGTIETLDFDGDEFPDVISGNQLLLSSRAANKGDFSDVVPINLTKVPRPWRWSASMPMATTISISSSFPVRTATWASPRRRQVALHYIQRGQRRPVQCRACVLDALAPPGGSTWTDAVSIASLGTPPPREDKIVIGFDDATNEMIFVTRPGTGLPDQWASQTMTGFRRRPFRTRPPSKRRRSWRSTSIPTASRSSCTCTTRGSTFSRRRTMARRGPSKRRSSARAARATLAWAISTTPG